MVHAKKAKRNAEQYPLNPAALENVREHLEMLLTTVKKENRQQSSLEGIGEQTMATCSPPLTPQLAAKP